MHFASTVPDQKEETTRYSFEMPKLSSLILTHELEGEVKGLKEWPKEERPPAAWVFWSFWIMVGIGMLMIATGLLARFKSDPRNAGQVMDRGLWRYSRHPNHFAECLIWWGLYLVAFSVPGGIWTMISPIIITLVLLKMTGAALTERTIVEHRRGYCDYQSCTSTFIPWWPKKAGQ